MTISVSRLYSGTKDLQSMLDLLAAIRPAARMSDYPSMVDLHELLTLRNVQENTRLWLDAKGSMVGYAFVDHYNNLQFEFDPHSAHPDIESEMVSWGVACIRRAMQEHGETLALDASCREDDTERIMLLERHGFVRLETRSLQMIRPLDLPIPEPQLPAGFMIRHAAGEQEVEALVALHRAAFGTENMTVEERLAMMRVPDYDAALDLLAVVPGGELAAYCLCSISREENERTGQHVGYTDPVATHPAYQRRGLAQALLLAGMRELKARGMEAAMLGTSSENAAMQRAAESVGFYVQSTTLWFTKAVSVNEVF